MSAELTIAAAVVAAVALGVAVFLGTAKWRQGQLSRLGNVLALAGLVIGVGAFAVSVRGVSGSGDDAPTGRDDSNGGGTVNVHGPVTGPVCMHVTGDCTASDLPPAEELAEYPIDDAQTLLDSIAGADADPQGDGPWPFLVLGTNGQGLFYRDGVTVDSHRLPGQPVQMDGHPIYADCYAVGWDPDPVAPNRSTPTSWLKVRYPEPGDVSRTFMYTGYAFPLGHNGNLPQCGSVDVAAAGAATSSSPR